MLGSLLGNYRVVELLGEGGMGVVYVGRHESLGHRVVVKVLQPELSRNTEMVQRFFNEAQAATSIRNLGITHVFDFGTTPDGRAYLVMELLEGVSLATRLEQRQLDFATCCRVGRQIANVLQAAHAAAIIHRDLKPDNLFLVPDDEVNGGERVKVLDFGIAKLAGDSHAAGVKTRTGLVMGTPNYMSPEQCRGSAVDPRSDIYSLGCILFEMTCGRPPFLGEGPGEVVGAHQHLPPRDPLEIVPDMPTELAALILKMLAKRPDERPQTMAAVSQSFDGVLRALDRQTPLPTSMLPRASTPLPVPQVSPFSTTLGGSAGMASAGPNPGQRRRTLLLGSVAIVSAGVIAVTVAVAGSGSSTNAKQAITPAPADADAAAIEKDKAAADITTDTDLETECRAYQVDRKWEELAACARKLKARNPEKATKLEALAIGETRTEPHIASVEAALHDKNLRRAKGELDQVWIGSSSYSAIKARYDAAESARIADLAVQLGRAKDADCKEYNDLLAKERAANPPRVAAEAMRRISCTPLPPMKCDPEKLAVRGQQKFAAGRVLEALLAYEEAYRCQPVPRWSEKAFVAACNAGYLLKARLHWRKLPAGMRTRSIGICLENRITEAMLNTP